MRDTEKEIARLERRSETMLKKIAASADHVEQRALDVELKALRQQLSEAEDRWLSYID